MTMAEAQLQFQITNQSLKRLDTYTPTEGSENYIHASFELDPDNNVTDAILAVFARYDDKVYIIPRNTETGLFDIDLPYLQYPGFHISCRIFNENVSRYTEEIFIPVSGNGNVLKRYLKAPDKYHIELLTDAYNTSAQNALDVRTLKYQMRVLELALQELSTNGVALFSTLAETIKLLQTEPTEPEPEEPEEPERVSVTLVADEGVFIGS